MVKLQLFNDYDRESVHDIFEPDTPFTPQAGSWGLHGIVPLKDRPSDFVFFVTFGKEQGDYKFDESISEEGVLRWQSQPRQILATSQIRRLIAHDELQNQVYLFLRGAARRGGQPTLYTYLGRLKYLNHDTERERPVHFAWQLLNWPVPQAVIERMQLSLERSSEVEAGVAIEEGGGLQAMPAPGNVKPTRSGSKTRQFQARLRANRSEDDKRNRERGLAGERATVIFEKKRLIAAGLEQLAIRVRHVSIEEGDGAGYDVLSFQEDGAPLYIEVKTTSGPAESDFYITPNEIAFSRAHERNYELRRIFDFDTKTGVGSFFTISGDVGRALHLTPTVYLASWVSGAFGRNSNVT